MFRKFLNKVKHKAENQKYSNEKLETIERIAKRKNISITSPEPKQEFWFKEPIQENNADNTVYVCGIPCKVNELPNNFWKMTNNSPLPNQQEECTGINHSTNLPFETSLDETGSLHLNFDPFDPGNKDKLNNAYFFHFSQKIPFDPDCSRLVKEKMSLDRNREKCFEIA